MGRRQVFEVICAHRPRSTASSQPSFQRWLSAGPSVKVRTIHSEARTRGADAALDFNGYTHVCTDIITYQGVLQNKVDQ